MTDANENPDVLEISDEDFLNMPLPDVSTNEETAVSTKDTVVEATEATTETVNNEEDKDVAVENTNSESSIEADTSEDSVTEEQAVIDYESEYKKIMTPFKANGREMVIKNPDDVITLMQMGANYHKKMAGMKPSLKTLKLLEKNNLLDAEKLNFLIDLHNRKPEAITKLIRDSGIEPLDINIKDESDYKPTQHYVSDTEIELDSVLDSIKSTPSYARTLNVITKEWDESSKNIIASSPNIISIINGHVEDGTYDTVMDAVNYERNLGKFQGVSDLEAYKQMGDMLSATGKLGKVDSKPVKETPKKTEEMVEREKRKKAVSSTKTVTTPTKPTTEFNPLSMSDAEFAKFDPTKFIKK